MNNRRKLVIALGTGALVWTSAMHAQAPAKVRRIGMLSPYSATESARWFQAFRQGLLDLGWMEGKNISIEYRYAEGKSDRLPELVADVIRNKVDVMVVSTSTDAGIAKKATKAIPIVMANAGDPVAMGLVESLARPGGNVTGLSQMTDELVAKRLELLEEMVPNLSRVAVLGNPQSSRAYTRYWKELQLLARQLGIELHSLDVRGPKDLDKAFEDAIHARAGALYIFSNQVFSANLERIADLAAKSRLPSIYHRSEFADASGLMTYGPDRADMFRRAATYVDKILKGAMPADLPVEQPTKFELVINMKTAKALGLVVPQIILVRVDRFIE